MGIGKRTIEESIRLFGSIRNTCDKLQVTQPQTCKWAHDEHYPSSYYLAKLAEYGADVNYILLGTHAEHT